VTVQNYPVRASHRKGLTTPALEEMLKTHFGSAEVDLDTVHCSYGAIARLSARPAGRELSVDLTMNPQVSEDVARETIRRYNQFLQAATGYSAKERARRIRQSAGAPGPGA
jgi:hypothetical protein